MYHWMAQDGGAAVMSLLVHYAIAGLVSGATFIASDVAAQVFLRKSARLKWPHLLRIGIFGLAIKGPLQSIYYDGVEAVSPGRGSASMVLAKMLVDLFCFSPLVNVLFLFCMPLLEGRTVKAAWKRVGAEIVSVQRAAMKFWIVAHFVNYCVISSEYRVLYVNFMGFAWTVILCCLARQTAILPKTLPMVNKPAVSSTGSPIKTARAPLTPNHHIENQNLQSYLPDAIQLQAAADALHHRGYAGTQESPVKRQEGTGGCQAIDMPAEQHKPREHGNRSWTLSNKIHSILQLSPFKISSRVAMVPLCVI